jgi:hypothetical protein
MTTENLYRRLTNVRTVIRIWIDAHPGQSLPEDMSNNLVEAEDDYKRVLEANNGSNG